MSLPIVASGTRIAAVQLACTDVRRTRAFYAAAFGFQDVLRRDLGRGAGRLPGVRTVREAARHDDRHLRLGAQRLDLVPARRPGRRLARSTSTAFQHFAIVVADMDAALRRLDRVHGWQPISRGGPQALPAASGGVTAFKFRDPDGHPLELLWFPDGGVPEAWREPARRAARASGRPCLGIDHTAIGVADTESSIRWYARFGFTVMERGVNQGIEQRRLDDVEDEVRVEVTGLRPPGGAPPHLELLCYREPGPRPERVPDGDRRATVSLLSRVPTQAGVSVRRGGWRDPDGHRWRAAGTR